MHTGTPAWGWLPGGHLGWLGDWVGTKQPWLRPNNTFTATCSQRYRFQTRCARGNDLVMIHLRLQVLLLSWALSCDILSFFQGRRVARSAMKITYYATLTNFGRVPDFRVRGLFLVIPEGTTRAQEACLRRRVPPQGARWAELSGFFHSPNPASALWRLPPPQTCFVFEFQDRRLPFRDGRDQGPPPKSR